MRKNKNRKHTRKDKVLHTRVPTEIEEALREKADAMRMPISGLIRNILEDAISLVDNVVSDSLAIADAVRQDAQQVAHTAKEGAKKIQQTSSKKRKNIPRLRGRRKREKSLDSICGWQEIILETRTICHKCRKMLLKGEKAMLGIGSDPANPIFLCTPCLTQHLREK